MFSVPHASGLKRCPQISVKREKQKESITLFKVAVVDMLGEQVQISRNVPNQVRGFLTMLFLGPIFSVPQARGFQRRASISLKGQKRRI